MSSFLSGLTVGSVLLGLALVIIVLLYLARPFAMPEDEETRVNREEIDGLLLRKESLLREIRELDDDYESAKVAPELYMVVRPQKVKQAATIMKQLDDHGYVEPAAGGFASPGVASPTPDVDAQIEAAVRRIRTPEQLDEQLEAAIQRARQNRGQPDPVPTAAGANGATSFCPQCGRRVEPGDRFCPACGHHHIQESNPAQATRA